MNRPHRKPPKSGLEPKAGFSLIEVLAAMTVAAVLATALISMQHQSLHLAEGAKGVWENINLAQDILARRFPEGLDSPTGGFINWPGVPGAQWRLEHQYGIEGDYDRMVLTTRISDSTASFEWHRVKPPAASPVRTVP